MEKFIHHINENARPLDVVESICYISEMPADHLLFCKPELAERVLRYNSVQRNFTTAEVTLLAFLSEPHAVVNAPLCIQYDRKVKM